MRIGDQLRHWQLVRAGGFGGGEIGRSQIAGFGGEGLVESAGLGSLAVNRVVTEVPKDGGNGHALGCRFAEVPAAVAVEVSGALAVLFEEASFLHRQRLLAGLDVLAE